MDLIGLLVAIGIGIALTLQASTCFFKHKRPLSIGSLDLILAALVIFACTSLLRGEMVLASEFGTVMVGGRNMAWLLRIALVFTAIAPALCWYRIGRVNGWHFRLAWFLLPAVLIGICSACRVLLLNPSDLSVLRVYQYDIWWPPMVAWFIVCFSGSVLALIKAETKLMGVALWAALAVGLAIFAIHHQDLADPRGRPVWNILERTSFVTVVLILSYIASESLKKQLRIVILVAIALVSGVFAILPDGTHPMFGTLYIPDQVRTAVSLVPLALLVIALVGAIIEQLPDLLKPQPSDNDNSRPAEAPVAQLSYAAKLLPFDRVSGIVLSISLPVIGLCLTDLFSLGYLNRTVDAIVIFTLWLFFAERLAEGALDTIPTLFKNGVLQLTIMKDIRDLFVRTLHIAGASAKSFILLATGGSESGVKAKTFFVTLWTIILAVGVLIVLTAIDEVTSYQKTIIKTFNSVQGIDSKDDIAAGISSEALINALGRLRRDLRPEILMAQRSPTSDHPVDIRLLKAGSDSSSVENAVAKSDELKLGGITFPVTFFVAPIQHLIRSFLGTREISATVQRSSAGSYIVLANSNDGDTWREFSDIAPKNKTGETKEAKTVPPDGTNAVESQKVTEDAKPEECSSFGPEQHDIAGKLVDRLAFDVASSDPAFIAAGLTKNPAAFDYFRTGLAHWQTYERSQDSKESEELHLAATCFRHAVELDKHFALAFYRLGLAMQRSNKPGAAVDAFRASVESNPEFVSAAATEAWTLFDFNAYYAQQTAGFPPIAPVRSRREEALKLWATLVALPGNSISVSERQSANYGVCLYYMSAVQESDQDPQVKVYYVPYFFCARAIALFSRLSGNIKRDPDKKSLEAVVLSALGVALESHRGYFRDIKPEQLPGSWSCAADAIDPDALQLNGTAARLRLFGSATSAAALRYYRQSLALVPLDRVVRCNEATANAFANADMSTMKYLGSDAGIHLTVAQSLIEMARKFAFSGSYASPQLASGYYNRALREFDTSAQLDPEFIDALNGYGYCYWEWWTNWRRGRTSMPPPNEVSYKAEHYAREGLRIAQLRALHETKSFANHSVPSKSGRAEKNEHNLSFDEMMIEDTLGEVLLAQGRVIEAVNHLTNVAVTNTSWLGLTETKWDLAQAEICIAKQVIGPSEKKASLRRAMSEFVNIRDSETDLELQPFTKADEALDPLLWAPTCPNRPDTAPRRVFPFSLQSHSYEPGPSCDWSGVAARLNVSTVGSAPYFHLWGGGIDRRVKAAREKRQSILLEAPPQDRTVYFFAQLEDGAGQPLSEVSVVDTFGNRKQAECSRNWITLVYSAEQKNATTVKMHRVAGLAPNN